VLQLFSRRSIPTSFCNASLRVIGLDLPIGIADLGHQVLARAYEPHQLPDAI
jgi:hypothetical protein